MNDLEQQAWELFIEIERPSRVELVDERHCKRLRTTAIYQFCCFHVALRSLGETILGELRKLL